jgi:nucleotide-binding universal stress UspA family protein
LKKIAALNIDVVIIGHHKHSLFYKAFVGNTDSELINKSTVPILLIPLHDDYDAEVSTVESDATLALW